MIEIRKAKLDDIQGIIDVCSAGYRNTYPDLLPQQYIEKIIADFYNEERVEKEIRNTSQAWNGWFVAIDNGKIVGAGGGGFTGEAVAELYVLYLDPKRKREGIGRKLLEAITNDQIERGAKKQWVSVTKGNLMGIPFYEAVGFTYQGEQSAYGLPKDEGFMSLRYMRSLATEASM